MKARDRFYPILEAVCLLTALVWCVTAFSNNNPIGPTIGADNAIFLSMGRGMADGLTPYVDIVENKGPLFFLLMAVPQMLTEGTAGVYVLEVLLFLGDLLLLLLCARWLAGGRRHGLLAAAALFLLIRLCGLGNFCEEYDFFFLLMGCAVMVHMYTGRRRGAGWRAFALGVATACIALIKISDILGLGVLVLFYFARVIRRRDGFVRELAKYVAGAAAVTLPVVAYLVSVGAFGAMLEEYILNNFVHVATAKDADFWEMRLWIIQNGYGWESLKPILWMAGAVVLRLAIYRKEPDAFKREKQMMLCMGVMAVANLAVAYVAGTGFYQHLLMGRATALVAGVLALSALLDWLSGKIVWLRWAEYAAALAVLAAVAVPAVQALAPERMEAVRAAYEQTHAEECELLPELEDVETVYTIGISPPWYWHTGLQPAFPYYNIVGFITDNVGEGLEYRFEAFMEENPPEALFINRDVEAYRGVLTNETLEYIQNNYELSVQDSGGRSLWKLI